MSNIHYNLKNKVTNLASLSAGNVRINKLILSFLQGMPANETRAIRHQLAEMTEKLKYDSNQSLLGFRQAVNQLAGAIGRHSQVQKNLDERFNDVLSKVSRDLFK